MTASIPRLEMEQLPDDLAAAVAILLLTGRYVTHSLIVNTLHLTPPVPSIFEEPK